MAKKKVPTEGKNKKVFRKDIAEHRGVEDALRDSERIFRDFVFAQPDPIEVLALDGTVLMCNEASAVAYGSTTAERIGRNAFDGIPPEVATERRGLLDRVKTTKQGFWINEHVRGRSYDTMLSPIVDQSGEVVKVAVFPHDVTERKQAETVIKTREKQLAESQRIAHIGSWEHNLTTGEVVWSDELFLLLGLDPKTDTAGFQLFSNLVHPDDRLKLKNAIVETVQLGKPFSIEYRLVCRDGTVRVIHACAELIQDDSGTQSILSGTAQDITERKRAEEKIRENEQFIRGILDTVDEGFIVIDRDYRILTANKAYCGQVGLLCDNVIGKHCYEISHKTNRPCYEEGEECAVRQVFATGEPHSVSHRHVDADRQVVYVETKAYPMKNSSGTVVSAIETVANITEKHLLEEERLKTQKLESIGTLAGGIAHDFNNLLQGVFGYISMARMTYDQKEKSLAMLEQAEKALHQSVNLTTQLLTFSKGGKPAKKPMSLEPVIESSVKFALSGSRTEYQLNIDQGLWQVNGDAGQLGQVIQNIVLNADQAMPLGGVVKIAARNAAANDVSLPSSLAQGNYVILTIVDNGVGIPEAYLNKIFDPYFTTKEKGSGLGLATSYSIIRNHEGQILVTSEAGKGSLFSLFIPALTTRSAAEAIGRSTPAAAPKARILVMDDEEIIRSLVMEILRELGHEVAVAAHGEATLAAYKEAAAAGRPFDIVILDLTVRGGMGGAETVQRLRELDPQVKAVVSSGYSDDAVIADHLKYGFTAFLKKPYDVDELGNVLNSLLSQGS